MSKLKWWGYLHTNGNIQVKRYFGPRDISEAIESPFCEKVTGEPFYAKHRADAIEQATELLKPN